MLSVKITIQGDSEELAKLEKLGSKLSDFSLAMKQIGEEAVSYYSNQVFDSEGGVIGHLWQNLSPVYRNWKNKHYRGTGILVASGRMRRSFTSNAKSQSVTIGNDTPYFKYHQSDAPRTRMPYRPMMAINNDIKNIVEQVIRTDIDQKLETI